MIMEPNQESLEQEQTARINVSYQPKLGLESSIVTGAMTSTTPDRLVNLVFFTERRVYPTHTHIDFSGDKPVEGEDEFEDGIGDAIVRELTHSIIISPSTAKFLIKSLSESLDNIGK